MTLCKRRIHAPTDPSIIHTHIKDLVNIFNANYRGQPMITTNNDGVSKKIVLLAIHITNELQSYGTLHAQITDVMISEFIFGLNSICNQMICPLLMNVVNELQESMDNPNTTSDVAKALSTSSMIRSIVQALQCYETFADILKECFASFSARMSYNYQGFTLGDISKSVIDRKLFHDYPVLGNIICEQLTIGILKRNALTRFLLESPELFIVKDSEPPPLLPTIFSEFKAHMDQQFQNDASIIYFGEVQAIHDLITIIQNLFHVDRHICRKFHHLISTPVPTPAPTPMPSASDFIHNNGDNGCRLTSSRFITSLVSPVASVHGSPHLANWSRLSYTILPEIVLRMRITLRYIYETILSKRSFLEFAQLMMFFWNAESKCEYSISDILLKFDIENKFLNADKINGMFLCELFGSGTYVSKSFFEVKELFLMGMQVSQETRKEEIAMIQSMFTLSNATTNEEEGMEMPNPSQQQFSQQQRMLKNFMDMLRNNPLIKTASIPNDWVANPYIVVASFTPNAHVQIQNMKVIAFQFIHFRKQRMQDKDGPLDQCNLSATTNSNIKNSSEQEEIISAKIEGLNYRGMALSTTPKAQQQQQATPSFSLFDPLVEITTAIEEEDVMFHEVFNMRDRHAFDMIRLIQKIEDVVHPFYYLEPLTFLHRQKSFWGTWGTEYGVDHDHDGTPLSANNSDNNNLPTSQILGPMDDFSILSQMGDFIKYWWYFIYAKYYEDAVIETLAQLSQDLKNDVWSKSVTCCNHGNEENDDIPLNVCQDHNANDNMYRQKALITLKLVCKRLEAIYNFTYMFFGACGVSDTTQNDGGSTSAIPTNVISDLAMRKTYLDKYMFYFPETTSLPEVTNNFDIWHDTIGNTSRFVDPTYLMMTFDAIHEWLMDLDFSTYFSNNDHHCRQSKIGIDDLLVMLIKDTCELSTGLTERQQKIYSVFFGDSVFQLHRNKTKHFSQKEDSSLKPDIGRNEEGKLCQMYELLSTTSDPGAINYDVYMVQKNAATTLSITMETKHILYLLISSLKLAHLQNSEINQRLMKQRHELSDSTATTIKTKRHELWGQTCLSKLQRVAMRVDARYNVVIPSTAQYVFSEDMTMSRNVMACIHNQTFGTHQHIVNAIVFSCVSLILEVNGRPTPNLKDVWDPAHTYSPSSIFSFHFCSKRKMISEFHDVMIPAPIQRQTGPAVKVFPSTKRAIQDDDDVGVRSRSMNELYNILARRQQQAEQNSIMTRNSSELSENPNTALGVLNDVNDQSGRWCASYVLDHTQMMQVPMMPSFSTDFLRAQTKYCHKQNMKLRFQISHEMSIVEMSFGPSFNSEKFSLTCNGLQAAVLQCFTSLQRSQTPATIRKLTNLDIDIIVPILISLQTSKSLPIVTFRNMDAIILLNEENTSLHNNDDATTQQTSLSLKTKNMVDVFMDPNHPWDLHPFFIQMMTTGYGITHQQQHEYIHHFSFIKTTEEEKRCNATKSHREIRSFVIPSNRHDTHSSSTLPFTIGYGVISEIFKLIYCIRLRMHENRKNNDSNHNEDADEDDDEENASAKKRKILTLSGNNDTVPLILDTPFSFSNWVYHKHIAAINAFLVRALKQEAHESHIAKERLFSLLNEHIQLPPFRLSCTMNAFEEIMKLLEGKDFVTIIRNTENFIYYKYEI